MKKGSSVEHRREQNYEVIYCELELSGSGQGLILGRGYGVFPQLFDIFIDGTITDLI